MPSIPRDPGLAALVPVDRETDVPWEGGRRLKTWWFAARGERRMPRLRDFSPAMMGRYLAGIIIFDVVRKGDLADFIVRLAGEDYRLASGISLKGRGMNAFPDSAPIRERFEWAVREGRPYMALDLPSHWSGKDFVRFKSLVVPLSEDGERVTHLMGHAHYYTASR